MEKSTDKPISESFRDGWYFLGGLIVGSAAGLLLAPKGGSEMRNDIEEYSRLGRKKAQSWLSSIGSVIPMRVKVAAGVGAVKNGVNEAFELAKDKAKTYVES